MGKIQQKSKLILGVSLSFILAGSTFAANKVSLNEQSNRLSANSNLYIFKSLNNSYSFKQIKLVQLPNGKSRYKIQQLYKGIPVVNASVVSSVSNLKTISNSDYITGLFIREIEQDLDSVRPAITKIQAITAAKNAANIINVKDIVNPNIELVIKIFENNVAKLVYLVDFFTDVNKPSRPNFIIDASNGEILESWEGLTTNEYVDATGPGGNEKTGKYYYGQDFNAMIAKQGVGNCLLDSPNVATYDMNNEKFGGTLHSFDCSENTHKEINGAYSPLNDAHYFGNIVYDMYEDWFNTTPLTFKLKMRVHYDTEFENAFWDGSQMTFGDGKWRFYPLISLDVVSHEVSHGFTQQNSGLVYRDQSGGINEAYSDIAGEAAEYYMNLHKPENERVDWLVGGTIIKNGTALRYFADPTQDNNSIGHARDYYDGINVHYSSGVFNKAFYILANTEGWDIHKAFEPFVLANQIYWNSSISFDEGGCGVIKATRDLEYKLDDVISAFREVGVDAACIQGPTDPDPKDPDPKDPDPKDPDPKDPDPKDPDPKDPDPKDPDPKDPDPKDPDPSEPDPNGAKELKNGVALADLSGEPGEIKLFYVDLPSNKYNLHIWNYGSMIYPVMRVAYDRVPSKADNDCSTEKAGSYRSCSVSKPKEGRYYIQLDADTIYTNLTLYISYY